MLHRKLVLQNVIGVIEERGKLWLIDFENYHVTEENRFLTAGSWAFNMLIHKKEYLQENFTKATYSNKVIKP